MKWSTESIRTVCTPYDCINGTARDSVSTGARDGCSSVQAAVLDPRWTDCLRLPPSRPAVRTTPPRPGRSSRSPHFGDSISTVVDETGWPEGIRVQQGADVAVTGVLSERPLGDRCASTGEEPRRAAHRDNAVTASPGRARAPRRACARWVLPRPGRRAIHLRDGVTRVPCAPRRRPAFLVSAEVEVP